MNMDQLFKQAQQFQKRIAEMQEDLGSRRVTSSVGGGMVQATVNGRHELVALTIEPTVIDPADPTLLQDLVIAAVNDAHSKAAAMAQEEMGKLTGGMRIPGLF
ncbi:MAG: YbaB/EbfC family nucleoid-associated protein [Thermodesulfobacteriota bacterium]